MSKAPKKKESKDRVPSAHVTSATLTAEAANNDPRSAKKKPAVPLWPEWSDADINNEKWDIAKKGTERGKSPNAACIFYDDPDGRIDLPDSLKMMTTCWKRPSDIFVDKEDGAQKNITVVDADYVQDVNCDLITPNENITHSEFVRWFVSSVSSLWQLLSSPAPDPTNSNLKLKPSGREPKDASSKADKTKKDVEEEASPWKPWQLIWPKDQSKLPYYNSAGKYAVKLFWMGCWRKIIVDDSIPCTESGESLLPLSIHGTELWPIILSKALIKVASLDFQGSPAHSELGEVNFIHLLTGWIPEPIVLRHANRDALWCKLRELLPVWDLSKIINEQRELAEAAAAAAAEGGDEAGAMGESKQELGVKDSKADDVKKKDGSGKVKGKDKENLKNDKSGKDKGKDEANLSLSSTKASTRTLETNKPPDPEHVVFVSYLNPPQNPCKMTEMRDMADASEKLRQFGLSHNLPHLVNVSQMRTTPLIAPPTAPPIPRWRLIRQKKKTSPVDQLPYVPVEVLDDKYLELSSPFVGYKVSKLPISRAASPQKYPKFNPHSTLDSLNETPREDSAEEVENNEEESVGAEKGQADALTTEAMKEHDMSMSSTVNSPLIPITPATPHAATTANPLATAAPPKDPKSPKSAKKGERAAALKESISQDKQPKDSRSASQQSQASVKSAGKKDAAAGKKGKGGADAKDRVRKKSGKEEKVELPPPPVSEKADSVAETPATAEEGGEGLPDGEKVEEPIVERETHPLWLHFQDFCQCFSTVWVFHKSSSYPYCKAITELKQPDNKEKPKPKLGAGLAPVAAVAASDTRPVTGGRHIMSPVVYASHSPLLDSPPPFLFVDSVEDSSVLVCVSALPRWFQPNIHIMAAGREDAKQMIAESFVPTPGVVIVEPYTWKHVDTGQPILTLSTTGIKAATINLPPGRHVLRFMIQSPLGYHISVSSKNSFVLGDEDSIMQPLKKESERFMLHSQQVMSELGSVVQSFSDDTCSEERRQDFLIGSESLENSVRENHFEILFTSLRMALQHELAEKYTSDMSFALNALKYECYLRSPKFSKEINFEEKEIDAIETASSTQILNAESPGAVLASAGDDISGNVEDNHASAAYNAEDDPPIANDDDATSLSSALGPDCISPTTDVGDTDKERVATRIQAAFRGHHTVLLKKSHQIGTSENTLVVEALGKLWSHVEANQEIVAVKLYRTMFDIDPSLLRLFPFHTDEWNKIAFADYNGSYPEQHTNAWFIICREVFFVKESVLLIPKLYANIPSCNLRVINNDTKEELKRVFMKIVPQTLHKNKLGYTFVAEGRSTTASVPSGKFRLRLIGEQDPLPSPRKEGHVTTAFSVREIQDYYIPDRNHVLFRYTLKTADHILTSIQLNTSNQHVYLKIQILDGEEEVASAEGRGHVVIPSLFFRKDRTLESIEEEERSRSRSTARINSGRSTAKGSSQSKHAASAKKERIMSPDKKEGRKKSNGTQDQTSRESVAPKSTEEEVVDTTEPLVVEFHKYVLQAFVQRDSWPLTRKQWDFIDDLKVQEKEKEKERLEMEANPELAAAVVAAAASTKPDAGAKGQSAKAKNTKKDAKDAKGNRSRPESQAQQHLDDTKPNWTFRVVIDANVDSAVEIKKDTARQDEVKAMKFAWEAAEPGRAEKALASRQKFLEANTIRAEPTEEVVIETTEGVEDGGDEAAEVEGETTDQPQVAPPLQPPHPSVEEASDAGLSSHSPVPSEFDSGELTLDRPAKESNAVLKHFDVTPYIRSTGEKVYLDAATEERMEEERARKFMEYSNERARVLARREDDRLRRNTLKCTQIEEYEAMQVELDTKIAELYASRELYRQKFIEKPPEDEPEVDPKKKRSPSPKKSGSKGKKKK